MIYANVNMVVKDYESVCDKKIVLYGGDKNVQIRFIIKDNKLLVAVLQHEAEICYVALNKKYSILWNS